MSLGIMFVAMHQIAIPPKAHQAVKKIVSVGLPAGSGFASIWRTRQLKKMGAEKHLKVC